MRAIMDARYLEAKGKLRLAEKLGVGLSGLAILAAILPEGPLALSWSVGVLSLVILAAQMVFSHHFRTAYGGAESIRQAFLLSDGLGEPVPATFLARLEPSGKAVSAPKEPYYNSHLQPGLPRLLMITWESAYFTEGLQKPFRRELWWYAFISTVGVVVAALLLLQGSEATVTAKVIAPAMAAVVTLNLWSRWWDCTQLQSLCAEVSSDCENLVRRGESPLTDVMQIVLRYSVAVAASHPWPERIYAANSESLKKGWNAIVASLDTDLDASGRA